MKSLKRIVLDLLYRSPVFPHIFFFVNPFKTNELRAIRERLRLQRADVVLDIGCGYGLQTNILGRAVERIIGIDVDPDPVRRAQSEQHLVAGKSRSEFRVTSIEDAAFPAASFDKIVSICVLEHIPDYLSVLRECHRVLKPDGRMVFSIDSLATIREPAIVELHRTRYKVQRYFRPAEIKADFERVGFRDVQVEHLFSSPLAADLFVAGIRRDWKYRYLEAWWLGWKIRLAEARAPARGESIFLIVSCRK